jgi:hypothetical protein
VLGGGGGASEPAAQKHDWPLLQTPVKPEGQLRWQALPHAPQLYGTVFRLTHRLSQAFLAPARPSQSTQAPPVQTLSPVQTLPHAPQLLGSFWRS